MTRPGTAWAIFCLYAGVALLSLGRGFYTSDGEVMYLTTAALVERGGFALAPDPGLPQIVPGARGEYYGKYDPGLPLLAVPFYVAGDRIAAANEAHRYGTAALAVLFLPALAAAGAVSGATALAVRLGADRGRARWVAAAAGLASPLWVYGRTLFAEALLACALTWSAALLVQERGRQSVTRRAALAGFVLGLGIAVRAALAIYALPLVALIAIEGIGAGGARRKIARQVAAFGAGMLPGIALVLWHNARCFGGALNFGYAGEGFTTAPWEGIAGLLFSPERSILLYAPPLILSAVLWRRWRRSDGRALVDVLALAWGIALAFYGSWWAWGGGWAWGPRLLVPLMPLSVLPWLALPPSRGWRIAAAILVGGGALINAAGVLVDVTPHFAASGDSSLRSAVGYALGEVAHGRTEPLALFHLADLGLPVTWQIGLPGLALGLMGMGIWGVFGGRFQTPPPE